MPSEAPVKVNPLTSRISSITYGNVTVKYATFQKTLLIQKANVLVSGHASQPWNICTYFSRRLDAFPDAEEAEDPAGQKTQGQLPSYSAQLLNACRHAQHPPPETKRKKTRGHAAYRDRWATLNVMIILTRMRRF